MCIIKIRNFKKNNNKEKIVGIIYGKNFINKKIEFEKKNFYNEKLKINTIITLKMLNNNLNVIIKDIKKHYYKNEILHIDFLINEK